MNVFEDENYYGNGNQNFVILLLKNLFNSKPQPYLVNLIFPKSKINYITFIWHYLGQAAETLHHVKFLLLGCEILSASIILCIKAQQG